MNPEQIQVIMQFFELDTSSLARLLGTAPLSVQRWEDGRHEVSGLYRELLQVFYHVALELQDAPAPRKRRAVATAQLGITAMVLSRLEGA